MNGGKMEKLKKVENLSFEEAFGALTTVLCPNSIRPYDERKMLNDKIPAEKHDAFYVVDTCEIDDIPEIAKFETALWTVDKDGYGICEIIIVGRYKTRREAFEGHDKIIEDVKNNQPDSYYSIQWKEEEPLW